MPEVILDGSSDEDRVLALMVFPHDAKRREQYFAWRRVMSAVDGKRDDEGVSVDAGTLQTLIDAPAYEDLLTHAEDATKQGVVAGDMLACLYLMDRFELGPSLRKADFVAKEFAKVAKYGDGSRMNYSGRYIKLAWNAFKPVVHFWAAFRLAKAYPFISVPTAIRERHLLASIENFPAFLSVAAGLYEFGTRYVPSRTHGKTPILDAGRCWTLPANVKPLQLHTKQPPNRLIATLQSYKARPRRK